MDMVLSLVAVLHTVVILKVILAQMLFLSLMTKVKFDLIKNYHLMFFYSTHGSP